MELDLDAFLDSHLTDDDIDDDDSQRRTVDEILFNDSYSSSSSDPSSPNQSDVANSKTLTLVHTSDSNPINRTVLFDNRINRSNVKPGAALAAAFAASRSSPSPHAAAIKLRRASAAAANDLQVVSEPLFVQTQLSSDFVVEEEEVVNDVLSSNVIDSFTDRIQKVVSEPHFVETHLSSDFVVEEEEEVVNDVSSSNVIDSFTDGIRVTNESTPDNFDLVSETHIDPTPTTSIEDRNSNVHSTDDSNIELVVTENINTDENYVSEYDNGSRMVEEVLNFVPDKHDEEELQLELASQETVIPGDGLELPFEDLNPQLGNKVSEISDEKSRSSMKPLDLAEELEKKYALVGSSQKKGAASQPMRLEGVHRGSTVLGYFDIDANNTVTRTISSETFRRDHGSAQVLAVHLNFIAVGMSKGVIICFPTKKPSSHADSDAKILMLGTQGDRSHASVMAMCFNRQGDLLFAGYADGHYTVWDVQKATSLKTIREHKAPVVHIFYLGLDSQSSRQFNVVSGDSKGVIKVTHFSIVPWVNRLNITKQVTLLDESTSTVVCASPLLSDEYSGGSVISGQGSATVNNSSIGSMMGGVVGGDWKLFEGSSLVEEGVVIFVSHQSALVAKVNPSVEVYAQLPKLEGVREGCMPYAAWKYMRQPCTSNNENVPEKTSERVGLLALAWDRTVQVAGLVKSKLKIYRKLTLESSAIGVAWLDDQLLVVLTSDGQLCLFETEEGTVIHQTSFFVDGSRGDDTIAYHTQFTNTFGNPEKAYHNCVAISGASVYILGPMQLTVSRLLPWKERIEVLRKAGDWIGALNMAISLHNGATHGVIDFPRKSDEVNNTVMPYLVELLLSYVDEVFSYISVAFCNHIGKLDQSEDSSSSGSVHSEIQEQFTRVGGVAVEFCVHIKRTDILFDEIHSRFVSVQHKDTFLELLEPYILNDKLGSLPPEIMQALVEHYSMRGWLQRIEQCVLHMDISSLDFNQVVRLCREHRLYGALIYLFNKGLDDFRTPLEELLVVLQSSQKDIAASIGYRMLVYLKYCFLGRAFPPGLGFLSPARLQSVRIELVQFLLEDSNIPNSPRPASSCFTGACPNLYHLLFLDTEATLDVLKCAFVEDEVRKSDHSSPDSALSNMDSTEDDSIQNLSQKMVDVLAVIIDKRYSQTDRSISNNDVESDEIWPSEKDISQVIEFIAYYISCGKATVSKYILSEILVYLTSTSDVDIHPIVSRQNLQRKREKQVLEILEVVTEIDWDASYLLSLCEKAQFYQVCGFIHATGHQNLVAVDSYMKDADEPIHAFSFISCTLLQLHGKESDAFKSEIMSRIPDLVILSREGTFFLVVEHFSGDHDRVLCELDSHPESLFLYLKTIMEAHTKGSLNFSCFRKGDNVNFPSGRWDSCQPNRIEAYLERISEFPKFMRDNPVHVNDKLVEQYLELLCQYEPSSVLKFLETFENYRVEHCLRLCQKYGVVDAAAFLLERVGDVGTALALTLSVLDDKFTMLSTAVQSLLSNATSMESFNTVLQKKEVNDILDIAHACIGLCQRNSPRMDFDESESLWFRLLDSFCEPLIDSHSSEVDSEGKFNTESLAKSLDREENEAVNRIRWKLSRFQKGAHILRKLFSSFIKVIVEGMIGYVRVPTIMMKLLSDNGSQEFGDFKLTILGMLGTYDFERRILDTAKSLIDDDNYYTMSQLKKGASHGYGPKSLLCCICNCPLAKNSTSSRIQVFNCGHTTHLQCELQEYEASQGGFSAGCPICIPKKNTKGSKSKSAPAEHGLVSRPLSRNHPAEGTSLHLNEGEATEGSYGYHQISRFEILSSLQKDGISNHVDNTPQLRLAPPALYHEKVKNGINFFSEASSSGKVKKGNDISRGETVGGFAKNRKTSKSRQLRDLKLKGSSIQFPLKANIFGKETTSRRLH